MTVRIKEFIIRYEDDGEISPLSTEEYKEKFLPLNLVIHHHMSSTSMQKKSDTEYVDEEDVVRIEVDPNKIKAK